MSGASRLKPRRLLLLGALLVVAALVATTVTQGARNQDLDDNQSFGIRYQGNPQQDCWRHHKSEGMVDSHVVIPIFPKAIVLGEKTDLKLQVENSWKYDLASYRVVLNLSNAPGIVSLGGSQQETPQPLETAWGDRLYNGFLEGQLPAAVRRESYKNLTFELGANPVFLQAELTLLYGPGAGASGVPNRVNSFFFTPGSRQMRPWTFGGDDPQSTNRVLTLPRGESLDRINLEEGLWRFQLNYESGDAEFVEYYVNVTAFYKAVGGAEVEIYNVERNPPDDEDVKPQTLVPKYGVLDLPPISIRGVERGPQTVRVMVEALLYYRHQAGGTPDEDRFQRFAEVTIEVGDVYIVSDVTGATAGVPQKDFYLSAAEITGFAGAFLLLPSLLFGGTYGRTSRKLFNAMLGGAKRRVMFHNLLSLGLILVALVHVIFFLIEIRYSIMMGILWGGLSAVSLLVLGLTGYYQVPLIQQYGYNFWRYIHLVCGVLVVLFVSWHAIQDGFHFFEPVKESLPEWAQRLNWAEPDKLK